VVESRLAVPNARLRSLAEKRSLCAAFEFGSVQVNDDAVKWNSGHDKTSLQYTYCNVRAFISMRVVRARRGVCCSSQKCNGTANFGATERARLVNTAELRSSHDGQLPLLRDELIQNN